MEIQGENNVIDNENKAMDNYSIYESYTINFT